MLISKKVNIKINPSNLKRLSKYYTNLKNGEIIEILVEHLSNSSHCLVDIICDICLKSNRIEYRKYHKSVSNGGYYACSQKCSKNKVIKTNLERYGEVNPAISNEVKEKIKQTNLERYGVENAYQSEYIKEKIKNICLKRYGVEYASQSSEVKEKIKQTNLEKYGVVNVYQSEYIKEKIKNICLERYGFEYAQQSTKVKEKIKRTNLKRYGFEYAQQSTKVKEKIKRTNLKRYEVENVFQSEEIKQKIKDTCLSRYGVEYACQNDDIHQKQIESGYKLKKHLCGLNYQGTYEKDFIDFCINNNITLTKSPFFNYELNNESKKYFPDFYYPKLNLIIEVKSTYYYNLHKKRNEAKKQSVLSNNYNYILIMDKNYDEFVNIIK